MAACATTVRRGWCLLELAAVLVVVQACHTVASPTSYRYTKTDEAQLLGGPGQYSVLVPQTRESWIASDGSGRLRITFGEAMYFGDNDRSEWRGRSTKRTEDQTFGAGQLAYTDTVNLPRDPAALGTLILADNKPGVQTNGGTGTAFTVWTAARSYLWETVAPQDLAQAILVLLESTNGVKVSKDQQDRLGRPAVACEVLSPGGAIRNILWLDPVTGALRGDEQILVKATTGIDAPPPVTIEYSSVIEARLVSSVGR